MKVSEMIRARVPADLKHDFEETASQHGLSASHVLRELMTQYVTQEKEVLQRREETLEALEDIEADRIVDGENVLSWLASWGTDNEQEPPL